MSALARMPGAARRARFEATEIPLFAPWVSAAHEGLRIAQLSDLHIGPGSPLFRVRCPPELSVFTLTRKGS